MATTCPLQKAVIVALKYEDGRPFLAMREVTVSEGPFDLEWKELTLDELKQELKKLDNW